MKYVDKPESVAEAARLIGAAPWASVDCEADSLHHYVEKLCLIQISVPDHDFVVDPLAGADLTPIMTAMSPKPLNLHGADFDIRMIRRFHGFRSTAHIFDTMIAAQLLGYDHQGYADLVERHCGEKLSKSSQKADWSRRPLDEKMLDYAVKDTHYLNPVKLQMEAELRELGRFEWHRQWCARLLNALMNETDAPREETGREWQVKGCRELSGKALTYLRELWYWRDKEARRRDRPSFKILNTEYLIEIAKWAVANPGTDAGMMPKAPSNVRHELREPINAALKRADAQPQAFVTQERGKFERKRWTNDDAKRFLQLKDERQALGNEFKLQPSLLGTNAALEILASGAPKTREEVEKLDCLMPWQIDLWEERLYKITNPPSKGS